MIDYLIVNPPSPDDDIIIRDINRSGRKTRERMIWPQTNLAYLAAMLKDLGSVEIIDCIATGMKWPELDSILKEKNPRYLISNAISTTLTNDMYTFFLGKRLGAITIVSGPHVTDLPEESLRRFPSVDYAIRGEAEETLRDLVNTLEAGGDPADVQGISYLEGDAYRENPDRPFIEDLDKLPFPMHHLLPLDRYRMPFFGNYTFIITSRGCPYKCIFCRQHVMWKGCVRSRSAESIFEEIKIVRDLGVKNIMFQADTFTVKRNVVIDLCRMIVESGIRIKWAANTHIASIDEEMVIWMKKAGCWMIAPGIESGSQEVLDNIQKGITLQQIREKITMIHRNGIEVWGYFVFGLPGDTIRTMDAGIRLARELPLDLANFAVAAPYPGTPFYRMAREKGWLVSENWEDYDQNYSAIVDYGTLTPEQIIAAIKKANFSFFARPKPILRIMRSIFRDPGMTGDLWRIFWQHLKYVFVPSAR